jgi:glycosyltransferase involved in cell wall biosynthesis
MKTTVIIPAYNASRFLGEALESIFRQTRPADEVIVVDDCSTDDTLAIARRFPVVVLPSRSNQGHAAARNLGIQAAQGDVIAWLDADDCFEPNHLEVVVALLEQNSQAAVAFSAVRIVGERSGVWGGFPCSEGPEEMLRHCLRRTVVPAMSAVTRTFALRSIGGFDSALRIAPDFDLWLRLSRSWRFISTELVTSNYRWHPSQISARPDRQIESVYLARRKYYRAVRAGQLCPFDISMVDLKEELLRNWERDMREAWQRRELSLLRAHATHGAWIPGRNSRIRSLLRRSLVPHRVVKAWDRMCGTA